MRLKFTICNICTSTAADTHVVAAVSVTNERCQCSGYGLYIGSIFTGAILYADDIALLACSCLGLQRLVNICVDYGLKCDIRFNPHKTQIACFGGKSPEHNTIMIADQLLSWADRIKYLGCFFKAGTARLTLLHLLPDSMTLTTIF